MGLMTCWDAWPFGHHPPVWNESGVNDALRHWASSRAANLHFRREPGDEQVYAKKASEEYRLKRNEQQLNRVDVKEHSAMRSRQVARVRKKSGVFPFQQHERAGEIFLGADMSH